MLDVLLVIAVIIVWFGLWAVFFGAVFYCLRLIDQADPVKAAKEISDRLVKIYGPCS